MVAVPVPVTSVTPRPAEGVTEVERRALQRLVRVDGGLQIEDDASGLEPQAELLEVDAQGFGQIGQHCLDGLQRSVSPRCRR